MVPKTTPEYQLGAVLWVSCPCYHTKQHTHRLHGRFRMPQRPKRGWQPNSWEYPPYSWETHEYSSPQSKLTHPLTPRAHRNTILRDLGEPHPLSFGVCFLGASSFRFNKTFPLQTVSPTLLISVLKGSRIPAPVTTMATGNASPISTFPGAAYWGERAPVLRTTSQ